MSKRKLLVLAAGLFAPAVLVASLSVAAPDEDSELHKIMEQVQAKNAAVLKGVRNKANFTKSHDEVIKSAEDLAKLGKQAKERFKDVDKPAQPQATYTERDFSAEMVATRSTAWANRALSTVRMRALSRGITRT